MAFKVNFNPVIKQLGKAYLETKRLKNKAISSATARKIGQETIKLMKQDIAKGSSPISGHGKFSAYRNKYRDDIKRGRYKNKKLRPVNLKLSGDFLKELDYQPANGITEVGFFDPINAAKERGHREQHNGQGFRPIIPATGEEFNRKIKKQHEKIYEKEIGSVMLRKIKRNLRKGN